MKRFCILQPMIPLNKRFDIFPPDWGMPRRSRCVQIFLLKILLIQYIIVQLIKMYCSGISTSSTDRGALAIYLTMGKERRTYINWFPWWVVLRYTSIAYTEQRGRIMEV